MAEFLQVTLDDHVLSIDAREAIRKGHHPRQEILKLVNEAPEYTLCEIHVPHRTGPLISAIQGMGLRVTVEQMAPGHVRLRTLKM